ncbi:MAG: hypothetical protein CBC35_00005 [Planctomycetes bacterium TMED75]|nr:hypothetical protein [Planctomycetaceae bacterium]OUU97068.1 MAG: hypothetical protein CBC35_00005 [Planctomycetes bacterium TMED75]
MTLIITILSLLLQAAGPDTGSRPSPPPEGPSTQVQEKPVIPSQKQPTLRALNPDRPPLLREGTLISRAVGSIEFDEGPGCWVFRNDLSDNLSSQGFRRTFYLMPSRSLEEFVVFANNEPSTSRFEIYGSVTVYEGANFLLPTLITPLVEAVSAPDPISDAKDAPPDAISERAPSNTLNNRSSEIADQLEMRLQDRIGFMPMSLDVPSEQGTDSTPGLIPDGTRLQNRAGTILRDQRTGAWRFLFDTQGSGRSDPSIEILPCLLLQEIQDRAMSNDLPTRIHASGVVTSFQRRNYLLLSIWRPGLSTRNLVR